MAGTLVRNDESVLRKFFVGEWGVPLQIIFDLYIYRRIGINLPTSFVFFSGINSVLQTRIPKTGGV